MQENEVLNNLDNLLEFHQRAVDKQRKYHDVRAIVGNQPENFFNVPCLPWVKYQHFDVQVFDESKFLSPVVT